MIHVLRTVVDPYTDATVKAGGAVIPGAEAEVSTQFIPAATISYFFTPNIAAEAGSWSLASSFPQSDAGARSCTHPQERSMILRGRLMGPLSQALATRGGNKR
jgi:outer membrane protein W